MDIIKLIEEVGADTLGIQFIDRSAVGFKRKKDHNEVTFVTDQDFSLKGTEQFGIVIWMDRGKAQAVFEKARAEKEQG